MDNIYVASAFIAFIVTTCLEWAKGTKWFPILEYDRGRINFYVSAVVAFLSSIGIVVSFDFNWSTYDFAVSMHGNMLEVAHLFQHALVQLVQQHGMYKGYAVARDIRSIAESLSPKEKPLVEIQ